MDLVTGAQMRERDRWAMEDIGLPGAVLMENAGRQVARLAVDLLGNPAGKRVQVVAGRGNNGGDGLVAARHLARAGAWVEVLLAARGEELKGDAALNLRVYRRLGLPLTEVVTGRELERVLPGLAAADLVIDALLGTGVRGPVTGFCADMIAGINDCRRPVVVAVDLPSGLDADTGACPGPVVTADHTVTLDAPKPGLCLYPGADRAGTLWVAEIGMPLGAPRGEPETLLLTPEFLGDHLPCRPRESHKGTWGRVLVAAGSRGMAGAAVLAARGALRVGAGLVTVAVPAEIQPQVAVQVPEAMTWPLPQTAGGTLAREALEMIGERLAGFDVLALGPGLSREPETGSLIRDLLPRVPVPVVVDADGLNALIGAAHILAAVPGPVVITPHPGEMARLCGCTGTAVREDRLGLARERAREWNSTVVLKGAGTVVAAPGGNAAVNPTGNPGLATGGTGDVLTGVIAGLLAQGLPPFAAAAAGVFLHGAAGDMGAAVKGEAGLVASDVVEFLPAALMALRDGTRDFLPRIRRLD